jgi:hypothetical protein
MCAKKIAALCAALALSAPFEVQAQNRVTSVSLAYDHFYREARNAIGYAQIFHDGGDTPSFEEWQAAKAHVPPGMDGLVSRCEPPVLQARALLVESYTIMETDRSPSGANTVNRMGAQAKQLLDTVSDCWQAMADFERNCLHALSIPRYHRELARRIIVGDEFNAGDPYRLKAEKNCASDPRRRPAAYPAPKLIGNVRERQPRPPQPPRGPIALNPMQPRSAPLPPQARPPNVPPGTIVFDEPRKRPCRTGFSTGTIRLTRPRPDGRVHVAGQEQNVIKVFVRICNDHSAGDVVQGTIPPPGGRPVKTYTWGSGTVIGSPPAAFVFNSLQMRDELLRTSRYTNQSLEVSLQPLAGR